MIRAALISIILIAALAASQAHVQTTRQWKTPESERAQRRCSVSALPPAFDSTDTRSLLCAFCSPRHCRDAPSLLPSLLCFSAAGCQAFELGDEIPLECRRNLTAFPNAFTASLPPRPTVLNPMLTPAAAAGAALAAAAEDALWGPGLLCAESNVPLSFRFGQDGFISCGWFVSNPDLYAFAAAVMKGDASWSCRVPMSKDKSFWLPVVMPLWGVVEPTHLHINYHMVSRHDTSEAAGNRTSMNGTRTAVPLSDSSSVHSAVSLSVCP